MLLYQVTNGGPQNLLSRKLVMVRIFSFIENHKEGYEIQDGDIGVWNGVRWYFVLAFCLIIVIKGKWKLKL